MSKVEEFIDPKFPGSSTHVREGDWIISRVEEYVPQEQNSSKKAIVLCYCCFQPVISPLEPLSRASQELGTLEGVGT